VGALSHPHTKYLSAWPAGSSPIRPFSKARNLHAKVREVLGREALYISHVYHCSHYLTPSFIEGMAPALFPPADGAHHEWPAPNFVNPETHSWAAPASIIALTGITFFIFLARIWARFRIMRTPGVDDWIIIASMPVLLGLSISTVLALTKLGFQLHIYDQTPQTNITVRQITLAMEIIYLGTTTLTKISILMFYRRISSSLLSRPLVITVWLSVAFGNLLLWISNIWRPADVIYSGRVWHILHLRTSFHLLARGGILVPLQHALAEVSQIPLS
jgi:hypothetical protein